MNDDFNTANAVSVLFELSRIANVYLNETNTDKEVLQAILNMFDVIGDVLGIQLKVEAGLLDEEIEALIEERNDLSYSCCNRCSCSSNSNAC